MIPHNVKQIILLILPKPDYRCKAEKKRNHG